MAQRPVFVVLWLASGFGLIRLSKSLETQGDIASAAGDRLFYHCIALLVLLGALACFVRVGWRALRTLFGRTASRTKELEQVFAENSEFDADAALARYIENRGPAREGVPHASRSTFGRKRV